MLGDEERGVGDGELLVRLLQGDQDAYRELHNRHARAVYRVALAHVGIPWEAEEIAATVFVELWRRCDNTRIVEGTIRPWLLTIASFVAKNQVRARRRYQRLLSRIPHEGPTPDHADEVGRLIDASCMSEDIRAELQQLSPRDANILLLSAVHECSLKDTALVLGLSVDTVKSRLARVKARLRLSLHRYAPSSPDVDA